LQGINGNLSGNYVLGANIDASATTNWNSGAGFDPLGDIITRFTGNFDGLGHTISNLYINRPTENYIGLFGYVGNVGSAVIRNVGVTDIDITGRDYVGGLIGNLYTGTVSNSYSTGSIKGIISGSYVGGLIGENSSSTVSNSYSTVNAGGGNNAEVGGLVGHNHRGTVSNSYSTGNAIGGNSAYVGGLVGKNGGTVTNSYYDKEANIGTMNDALGYGKTTAELMTLAKANWDANYWSFGAGANVEGYEAALRPYLTGVTTQIDKPTTTILFNAGFGTEESPYTITNWTQLQNIDNSAVVSNNYNYILSNNLDVTSEGYSSIVSDHINYSIGFNPIGDATNKFVGTFDGLGNTIDALYINNSTDMYVGLFGYAYNAVIRNVGLTDVDIKGTFLDNENNGVAVIAGGLGGKLSSSTVSNSYVTGSVKGDADEAHAGGIVGDLHFSTINNSYTTATIHGGANSTIGGLVGYSSQATITNSFYDKTLNTGMSDENAYGKTTAEMQKIATYTTNITNENDRWNMTIDSTQSKIYPYLVYDAQSGTSSWKIGTYSTALNYTLGEKNTTYNGTNQSLNEFWSNSIFGDVGSSLLYGEDYKFTYNENDVTSFINAGSYNNIAVEILNSDYELDTNGNNTFGSLTIDKKAIGISVSKTYDGNTSFNTGFVLNSDDIVEGDTFSIEAAATVDSFNVNNYTSFNTSNITLGNDNYTLEGGSILATITPKAITVSANNLSKIYGNEDENLTYSANGLVGSDSLTGSLKRVEGENVGEYTISQNTELSNSNYTVSFTDGKYTITPKAITVSANDLSKIYGQTDSLLTYVVQGLVGNDVLEGLISRENGETVGEYLVNNSTLSNPNYSIRFNNGIFTIKRNEILDNTLTSIINTNVLQTPKINIVVPQQVVTNTPTNSFNGQSVNLVSKPLENQPTKMISMSEIKASNTDSSNPSGNSDVRVSIGNSSVIDLVNGGVNLPFGLEQQFFVVDNDDSNKI
jgi:hypothetical protein